MATTIRLRINGPYLVDGDDMRIVDWNGVEYPIERRPVALCRCGHSKTRPFCDGSHRALPFSADEAAPER